MMKLEQGWHEEEHGLPACVCGELGVEGSGQQRPRPDCHHHFTLALRICSLHLKHQAWACHHNHGRHESYWEHRALHRSLHRHALCRNSRLHVYAVPAAHAHLLFRRELVGGQGLRVHALKVLFTRVGLKPATKLSRGG